MVWMHLHFDDIAIARAGTIQEILLDGILRFEYIVESHGYNHLLYPSFVDTAFTVGGGLHCRATAEVVRAAAP